MRKTVPVATALIVLAVSAQGAMAAKKVVTHYTYASHGKAWMQFVEAKAKEFEKANPGIQVKFLPGSGDWKSYAEKLMVSVVGGKAPDILELYPGIAAPFVKAGQLLDLKPYITSDSTFNLAKYYKVNVEMFSNKGSIWGVPTVGGTIATMWNKTLFQEAGLTSPNALKASGHWNWESFMDAARRLTRDKNGDGKPEVWGVNAWVDLYRFYIWIHQAGGNPYDRMFEPTKARFNDAEVRKGLAFYTEWWTKYNVVGGDFRQKLDSVGMYPQSVPSDVADIALTFKGKLKYDVVSMPKGPRNDGTLALGNGFQIAKASKNKKEAWAWLRFLCGPGMQREWVKASGRTPVLRTLGKDYEELAPMAPEHVSEYMDQQDNPHTIPFPDSSYTEFRSMANDAITQVITKKKSLDQVLTEIDQKYGVNLKRVARQ